jgi:hypothetical protein
MPSTSPLTTPVRLANHSLDDARFDTVLGTAGYAGEELSSVAIIERLGENWLAARY